MEDVHFGLTSSDMLANLAGGPSASIGWAFQCFVFMGVGCRFYSNTFGFVADTQPYTHHWPTIEPISSQHQFTPSTFPWNLQWI